MTSNPHEKGSRHVQPVPGLSDQDPEVCTGEVATVNTGSGCTPVEPVELEEPAAPSREAEKDLRPD